MVSEAPENAASAGEPCGCGPQPSEQKKSNAYRMTEDAEGEHRHVGDGVLEARGDERQQRPPQADELGRITRRARRHPQCEAHQHVAEDRAHEQLPAGERRLALHNARQCRHEHCLFPLRRARAHDARRVHQRREQHRAEEVAEQ